MISLWSHSNIYNKLKDCFTKKVFMRILNYLNKKFMAFRDIFKDKNDLNEKSIIGFMSFAVMVLFAVADLVTGYLGKDLVVQEFIYNSFLVITLGCFGIAGVEKIFTKKDKSEDEFTEEI